ncbi:hypothetical protein [Mesorhizobium sp. M7A.F.Ca.CA.002.12.1.1]|uniref:hypothetical protein n=1 Tax=Mesorhizobium sp. M7A.F.Ca.CA.002.12.1.1 TaxID=2496735 RepID=UPI000FCA280E|nr:hypothetical protein [Mesorhizobium sp. M7A.F.Ca.CA.002.12.1.1]RUX60196.1 hypothetical protein EN989_11320 [Mesorhizobium sp. M7A.F.Ca.CA.002.12.1.1]
MSELADVQLLLRFPPKPGAKSLAFAKDSDDLKNEPIFLPKREIEIYDTGRKEAGLPIITVTMPQWLAEDRELV